MLGIRIWRRFDLIQHLFSTMPNPADVSPCQAVECPDGELAESFISAFKVELLCLNFGCSSPEVRGERELLTTTFV